MGSTKGGLPSAVWRRACARRTGDGLGVGAAGLCPYPYPYPYPYP